jgi:hypothetical protein
MKDCSCLKLVGYFYIRLLLAFSFDHEAYVDPAPVASVKYSYGDATTETIEKS